MCVPNGKLNIWNKRKIMRKQEAELGIFVELISTAQRGKLVEV
jgi:hypothetical protein